MDQNNIFWLDVAMQQSFAMHISYGLQQVLDNKCCSLFTVLDLTKHLLIKLSIGCQFHQNINVASVVKAAVQVNQIRMVKECLYLEFSCKLIC